MMPTVRSGALLPALALVVSACATNPAGPPAEVAPTSPVVREQPVTERPATPLAERRAPDPRNVVVDPSGFQDMEWHWIGPARGGRVTAVTGVVGEPGTYYFGATGGGVWKTTDYGQSWHNLSDGWFETPSIGGIRVAESNPDVIWVATGSDGLRSNIINGLGVYRSTDGGDTWRFLGLRDIGITGAIEVDPRDADVAYVAAIGNPFGPNPERGLFRTRDGGATWENVLFISDSTGIVDVEIDPRDPDVLYASSWRGERKPWTIISGAREGGVYKSTDGGDSWTRLGGGLPTDEGELFGKIDLAVVRSNPDILYALIEAPDPADGLYRSDDAGASWRQVSSDSRLTARAFYYTNVDVTPTDPDDVWVNAHVPLLRSNDGGKSWRRVPIPHSDAHDIWIDPDDPDLMIQGNDGGANVSRDGARTWSTQSNQPTAELYSVDLDDRFPYWAYSGQQDASAIGVASRAPAVGDPAVHLGCETGPAVPKPGDPDVVYNNCKGRFMVWHRETGENQNYYVGAVYMYGHASRDLPYRMQRVTPIEVSPHDPDRVYYGTQYVMVTEDGGVTWQRLSDDLTATPAGTQGISGEPITRDITGEEVYSTLYAIEESPVRQGVIWVGSYDGPFHVSTDNGASWREITPPDLAPGGRVQGIDASPHDAGTAIYSVMRFMLDDWRPYVYRTRDFGETWELLTTGDNGIPADYPVRIVREDPVRPGLLYAGAEYGFYVSFDDGAHWQPLQLDLPAVPVTDIAFAPRGAALPTTAADRLDTELYYGGDLVISTMGRGFHVLRDLTPLRELGVANGRGSGREGSRLYQPAPATLAEWWSGGRGAVAQERGQPGAVIDFTLAAVPDGPLTVELLGPGGAVVNGWSSEDDGYEMV
ncbi:MAG: WD40/YVTN/BNR-like repeat-containing protein, partial [Gemmatimonadota bacterium]